MIRNSAFAAIALTVFTAFCLAQGEIPLNKEEQESLAKINAAASKLSATEQKAVKTLVEADEDAPLLSAARQLQTIAAQRRVLQVEFASWLEKARKDHKCEDCLPTEDGKSLLAQSKPKEPARK